MESREGRRRTAPGAVGQATSVRYYKLTGLTFQWTGVAVATAIPACGTVPGVAPVGCPKTRSESLRLVEALKMGAQQSPALLDREEYIEQAYFFRALGERVVQNMSTQDLLDSLRVEVLSTTNLPMAIDFLASELRLQGVFAPAMARLAHYFTAFQTYVISCAESERSKFDFRVGLEVLRREAEYRAEQPSRQGIFLYQFEVLCRNRLGYDHGLEAIADDPMFDADWKQWILSIRRQIGIIDFADLMYVRSRYYEMNQAQRGIESSDPVHPILFEEKEGKIALAHRHKDPLLLFSALERHLGYPAVPRAKAPDESTRHVLPLLLRRVDRLESRLKLLEEEQKGGIDLSRFYKPPE